MTRVSIDVEAEVYPDRTPSEYEQAVVVAILAALAEPGGRVWAARVEGERATATLNAEDLEDDDDA